MLAPAALRLGARLAAASSAQGLLPAAACVGTTPAAGTWRVLQVSSGRPFSAALHEGGPAPAGPADAVNKEEGDTYFATPQYPGHAGQQQAGDASQPGSEDGGSYAAAASRAPHPSGAADTSSMNSPEGRAAPDESGAPHSAARDAAIHHPGREQEVLGLNNKDVKLSTGNSTPQGTGSTGGISGSSGTRRMFGSAAAGEGGGAGVGRSFGGEGAGSDSQPGQGGQPEQQPLEFQEGGAAGGVAGSWRAMTADFAAGGDDMTGGGSAGTVAEDAAMAVNPDSGLPQMTDTADAGAGKAGFGRLRDPSQAPEEGGDVVMREGEKSTGQIPADTASG